MEKKQQRATYVQRLLMALPVWAALSYTFVFFGPLEMIAFSGDSLDYSYLSATPPLILAAVAICIVLAPLSALLRGKVFDVFISLVFGIVVCGYFQAAFFNGGLGLLTGDRIPWEEMTGQILLNIGVWLFLLADVIFLLFFKREWWKPAVLFISAALIFMQAAPTVAIYTGQYDEPQQEKGSFLSTEGMYEFSPQNNTFVFVLDRLDYDYLQYALSINPDFLDHLDGFTCYTDAISAQARTSPALNHLLTGAWEQAYAVPTQEYYENSWTVHGESLLTTLDNAGCDVGLYAKYSDLFAADSRHAEAVSNLATTEKELHALPFIQKILRLSAFRYAPLVLKDCFFMDTNELNKGVFVEKTAVPYAIDDVKNYLGFAQSQLVSDLDSTLRFYHFNGTHSPFYMNADGTESEAETDLYAQITGTFKHLRQVFQKMKELGIYKNATIIITGDHGNAVYDSKPLQKATRTGIFYKPAGAENTPLTYSGAPVTTGNIPATILKAAGLDYSAFGPALDDIAEDDQITRYYQKSVAETQNWHEAELYIYKIVGKASDFSNWTVERVEKIQKGHNFY